MNYICNKDTIIIDPKFNQSLNNNDLQIISKFKKIIFSNYKLNKITFEYYKVKRFNDFKKKIKKKLSH